MLFDWFTKRAKKAPRPIPTPDNQSTPPAVTLRWLLGLSGLLTDGSNESVRFRENVESPNIRLPELKEWAQEALESPHDEQRLFALQDIINSLGTRLGFQVEYGAYSDDNADWMPFDGLWRCREDLYLAVEVFSDPLERIDFKRLESDLASLASNPAIGAADTVACFLLCDGATAVVEDQIRASRLHNRIRLMPLGTLFDLMRMDEEGILDRNQLPVLLRPFSSIGIHRMLGFLEEFIGAYNSSGPAPVAYDPELPAPPPPPRPPEVSLDAVMDLRKAGQTAIAGERLRAYLSSHPEDAEAWETAADWAREEGDMEAATRAYRAALSRDRNRIGPVVALAAIYREQGEYASSQAILDGAGGLAAPAPVLLERARLMLNMDHAEEAERAAQAAHAAGADGLGLCLLAEARQHQGNLEGAEAALQTALERDPDDPEALRLLDSVAEQRRRAEPLPRTGS